MIFPQRISPKGTIMSNSAWQPPSGWEHARRVWTAWCRRCDTLSTHETEADAAAADDAHTCAPPPRPASPARRTRPTGKRGACICCRKRARSNPDKWLGRLCKTCRTKPGPRERYRYKAGPPNARKVAWSDLDLPRRDPHGISTRWCGCGVRLEAEHRHMVTMLLAHRQLCDDGRIYTTDPTSREDTPDGQP